MKIVSFGDSFVYGSELNNEIDDAWPAISARILNCQYETYAIPGCGNDRIVQQVYNFLSKNSVTDVLIVINWTWISRWDFFITKNSCNFFDVTQIRQETYETMAGVDWPTYQHFVKGNYYVNETVYKELQNFCKSYIGVGSGKWFTLGPTCTPKKLDWIHETSADALLNFYNDYTGKSLLWNKFRNLQAILSCQYILESMKVKNIQTYMDHELLDSTQPDMSPEYVQAMQKIISPKLELFENNMNFLEWARYNKYPVTDWPGDHPLEEAHQAAAELWFSKYKAKLL